MDLPQEKAGSDDDSSTDLPGEPARHAKADRPLQRHRRLTWVFAGTSVVLAIALIVVVSVFAGQQRAAGQDTTDAPAPVTQASRSAGAGDTGPVSVIADDPTCAEWTRISTSLVAAQNRVLWFDRDGSIPAVEWTPEQSAMYGTVAKAMGSVTVQTAALARATPHRVMSEIYQQIVAYAHEVTNRIPQYQAADIEVFRTTDTLVAAASAICAAALSGAAQSRTPLTTPAAPPTNPLPPRQEPDRKTLLAGNPSICAEWVPLSTSYTAETADWNAADWQAPVAEWTYNQQYLSDATIPVIVQFADQSEELSRRSNNPIAEDLVVLAAQYLRAYVLSLPTYVPADRALADAASNLTKVVDHACAGMT